MIYVLLHTGDGHCITAGGQRFESAQCIWHEAYLKIGFTNGDARDRLAQLQTGNPHPLRLIKMMPGTSEDEKRAHALLCRFRRQGTEWFRDAEEVRWLLDLPPCPAGLHPLVFETGQQLEEEDRQRAVEEQAAVRTNIRLQVAANRQEEARRATLGPGGMPRKQQQGEDLPR